MLSRIPYYFYKFYSILNKYRVPFVPAILMILNRLVFGAYVPPSCQLGSGTRFGYGGCAVVIHARAVIGKNCLIGPGVTVGGRSKMDGVPVIGDNVYMAGGSKILGDIRIGKNVVIGANSVVISNVQDNCVVAGVPARVIKEDIHPSDYV
jgi:serine O-acetyltransferase